MQWVGSPNSSGFGLDRGLRTLNVDDVKHGEFQLPLTSLQDAPVFWLEGNPVCL